MKRSPTKGAAANKRLAKRRSPFLNILVASMLLTLLLGACVPGTRRAVPFVLEPTPHFRSVTAEEASRALEYAELEFMFDSQAERGEAVVSPLSGIISPAYRHVVPEMRFRASGLEVTEDASYRQIYYWNLQPLGLEEMRPGDLIVYSDGAGLVTGAGLFAGWRERDRSFRVLIADEATGSASYRNWDLQEEGQIGRLVAMGRLFIAADPETDE